eukprot:363291-Chlamydomonas_euryale.AAC.32
MLAGARELQSRAMSKSQHDDDDMDLSPETVVKPARFAAGTKAKSGDLAIGIYDDFATGSNTPDAVGEDMAMPWAGPQMLDVLSSPSVDCPSLSDLLDNSEEEDLLL